ncbi:phage tail tape measure protein [Pseudomonas botevensis]|uniref:phage tail tape measure protein n=1 Tax=Pseudomonas botevensis TaxID=2842352 RepID=UPI001C3DBA03|nr:phage tail tape measure protein [Pseudomonas botevensis]MBV4476154.1 phage tail tape measure protein [Pseudomonas botevensis]
MAETKYGLMLSTMSGSAGFSDTGLVGGLSGADVLAKPLAELALTLVTTSQDIRLLIKEQVKLREVLASQQSLFRPGAPVPASVAAPVSEPKSKLTAEVEQRPPPGYLQSRMALDSAMSQLRQIPGLGSDLNAMSVANLQMATDKRVAKSGATAVDLAQVEYSAARSGIGAGLKGKDQQQALLDFARDAAINASAFGIGLKASAEMLTGWRTSLKLDRNQGQHLADATYLLGNSGLKATAADIGSVVQQSGESAKAAGIAPEQTAALSAALLNADMDKSGAGATVKNISGALAKGTNGSTAEQSAWKSLGLEPGKLTENVPDNLVKALEALKQQPVERQSALIKTLFNGDEGVRKLLDKPDDLKKAFSLVGVGKLEGSSTPVPGESARRNLKSLASGDGGGRQWLEKAEDPQKPLSLLKPSAAMDPLTPAYSGSIDRAANTAANDPQRSWNVLDASINRLITALMPDPTGAVDSLAGAVNGMADMAESNPKTSAGLAVAAAGLMAIVTAVLGKAFDNFAGRLVKSAAAKLPRGLGKWITEDDPPKSDAGTTPEDPTPAKPSRKTSGQKPSSEQKGTRLKPRWVDIKSGSRRRRARLPRSDRADVVAQSPVVSEPFEWPATMTAFAGSSRVSSPPAAPLSGSVAKAGALLAKKAPPLRLLSAGYEMVTGVMQGDTRSVVSSGASLAGSSAGAAIGAALGTLILPGVGTMIGGWLGSMAGGEIGASLGDKLGNQVDRLSSPAQVSKDLIATSSPTPVSSQANSQPVTFNSTIQIQGQDLASAQALANLVVQTTMAQLGQVMPTNALATRRDAALTDGVAT